MTVNQAIVAAARGWIGTRFHHQGRIKKNPHHRGGVDCLGLLVGVARELDLRLENDMPLANLDRIDYSHFPDTQQLYSTLSFALKPIDPFTVKPGNILLFEIDNRPQHLAITSDYQSALGIIHAYAQARAVVEHALDNWWQARIKAAFSI